MSNTVTVTATDLVVEPVGLDKLWSFTKALTVPLAHVRGATHDPGIGREPKGWRGPGLRVGDKLAGTFRAGGERQFWNVTRYENAVVITLDDTQEYNRLILTVDDPDAVTSAVNAALAPPNPTA